MTIKLFGVKISNFYNIAKLGFLEKKVDFEEVDFWPNVKSNELLKASPAGRIPFIEFKGRFLSESQAILRFLDHLVTEPAFFPKDPMCAGRTQQIHQFLDLYLDPPVRRLLGPAFFGEPVEPGQIAACEAELFGAITALSQVVSFTPFIAGPMFTPADFAAVMHLDLADRVMNRLNCETPSAQLYGYQTYYQELARRPSFRQTLRDRELAFEKLLPSA